MTESNRQLGMFTTDADLIVRSWDTWLHHATGIPAEDACGQSLTDLCPDLEARGLVARFQNTLAQGTVEVLAPAFHSYLLPCKPLAPSTHFEQMQQYVVIAPLRSAEEIVGTFVVIEDVTERLEGERPLPDEQGKPGPEEQLEPSASDIIQDLDDMDWQTRKAAVDSLGRRGGAAAATVLLRTLREQHRNPSALNSALQVLSLIDVDVVDPLIEFLQDEDAELRTYTALALGEQNDPRAIPALIQSLDDEDTNVRYHAIEALGKLRATEALDQLVGIAESGDFFLAFPAVDAVANVGDRRVAPRLVPLLDDPVLRSPVALALGQLGDEAVLAPLAEILNKPGAPVLAITKALESLYNRYETKYGAGAAVVDQVRASVRPPAAHSLIDALDQASVEDLPSLVLVLGWLEDESVERALTSLLGDDRVRKEVLEALVRHGERVTDLLIDRLDAEDVEIRRAAIIALGRTGDPRSVPALTCALSADEPELIVTAAGALAKIDDRRPFEELLALLGHDDAAVRQAAISALNSLGHPDMAERIRSLLSDPNPQVRESAVRIAGYFGYPETAELLFQCCDDPDENVRRAAVEHIAFTEDPGVVPRLAETLSHDSPRVRAAAAQALGQVDGRQAFPYLVSAVRDDDPWVRYYAVLSIGRHGYPEAVEILARFVKSSAEAPQVRIAAVEALGKISGARAIATLAPLAESEDRDISRAVLSALGLIAHPNAVPPLLAALRSPNPSRRAEAVNALGTHSAAGAVGALQWVAATDSDAQVARLAIEALGRLGTPEGVGALIALAIDPTHREACVSVLAKQPPQRINLVARGLAHGQPAARCATVDALTRMNHPTATEALEPALHDRDPAVRLAAVTALGYLGSHIWEEELVMMAHSDPDPAVRQEAQDALRR